MTVLGKLHRDIEAGAAAGTHLVRVVRHAASWFWTPNVLRTLMEELEQNPETVGLLAAMSYAHHNGFSKIVISTSDTPFRIRMHYWPVALTRMPQNIHNHCFDFVSHICAGSLIEHGWRVVDEHQADLTVAGYSYQTKVLGEAYHLTPAAGASLKLDQTLQLSEGTTYLRSRSALHQSWVPPEQSVVTLFVEDRRRGLTPAQVYAVQEIPADGVLASPSLTSREFMSILRAIVCETVR